MDCVTHKPPRNRYHTAMAIALTLLLQDLWYEPSLRGWDSAAELVCYYQLDPQNRHSHPLSLELSLSQPLSWMLLGATSSVSCWIQKVLELIASPSVWANTVGTFALLPLQHYPAVTGDTGTCGALGLQDDDEMSWAGKDLSWEVPAMGQAAVNEAGVLLWISRFRRIHALMELV